MQFRGICFVLFLVFPSLLFNKILAAEHSYNNVKHYSLTRDLGVTDIDLGGELHITFTTVDGKENKATTFNRQIFELFAGAAFNEDWSVFIAQKFRREVDITFDDAPGHL